MICPNCKKEMIVVERNEVELDYCMFCEGFWFDSGEWNILCKKLISQDLLNNSADIYEIPQAATYERKKRCPVCGCKMEKFNLAGVLLDRCPKKHGVWFDKNEFSTCVNRITSGGQTELAGVEQDKQGADPFNASNQKANCEQIMFLGEVFNK